MKTRQGLVSNSSTSSFIVVGYKLKYDHRDKNSLLEIVKKLDPTKIDANDTEAAWDILYELQNEGREDGLEIFLDGEDGSVYVGIVLADVSSDGDSLENKAYDIKDLVEKCNIAKKLLDTQEDPKIYTGTRAC